jgi:hypothetical protein
MCFANKLSAKYFRQGSWTQRDMWPLVFSTLWKMHTMPLRDKNYAKRDLNPLSMFVFYLSLRHHAMATWKEMFATRLNCKVCNNIKTFLTYNRIRQWNANLLYLNIPLEWTQVGFYLTISKIPDLFRRRWVTTSLRQFFDTCVHIKQKTKIHKKIKEQK